MSSPYPPPYRRPRRPRKAPAAVPRRFGAGTLLVLTTVCAVMFGAFRALGLGWWVFAGASLFFAAIGVAQMFAGPARARWASLLTGLVVYPLVVIPGWVLAEGDGFDGCLAFFFWIPAGYLGGTLVAGIFLIMRWADERLGRRSDLDLGQQDQHAGSLADDVPVVEFVLAEVVEEELVEDPIALPDSPRAATPSGRPQSPADPS